MNYKGKERLWHFCPWRDIALHRDTNKHCSAKNDWEEGDRLMSFSDDGGGFAFACDDGKICINASTWNTRLSQIGRFGDRIRIITNKLPNVEYIKEILSKRPNDIFIVCHSHSLEEAKQLKAIFPEVRIATIDSSNSKIVLVAPRTVWISSADFGYSDLANSTVGLHSESVHDRIVKEVFEPLWEKSSEVSGEVRFWT